MVMHSTKKTMVTLYHDVLHRQVFGPQVHDTCENVGACSRCISQKGASYVTFFSAGTSKAAVAAIMCSAGHIARDFTTLHAQRFQPHLECCIVAVVLWYACRGGRGNRCQAI